MRFYSTSFLCFLSAKKENNFRCALYQRIRSLTTDDVALLQRTGRDRNRENPLSSSVELSLALHIYQVPMAWQAGRRDRGGGGVGGGGCGVGGGWLAVAAAPDALWPEDRDGRARRMPHPGELRTQPCPVFSLACPPARLCRPHRRERGHRHRQGRRRQGASADAAGRGTSISCTQPSLTRQFSWSGAGRC